MPVSLIRGQALVDFANKVWQVGDLIGNGGCGMVYSAHKFPSDESNYYPYAIKIEMRSNSRSLFKERNFYTKNLKPADVQEFINRKKLTGLGIPKFFGAGSLEYEGQNYYFLIIQRLGSDVWRLCQTDESHLSEENIYKVGIQILDTLEYMHSRGYIHGDIKGSNILMGVEEQANKQVYLVDFGKSMHYDDTFKPNPNKPLLGTREYCSRDAHLGVASRRSDLESLGYNLTRWFGRLLPWTYIKKDSIALHESKEKYMANLPNFFKTCFNTKPPVALVQYFRYVTKLDFETIPDYKKLHQILLNALHTADGSLQSPFKCTVSTHTKCKTNSKSQIKGKKQKLSKPKRKRVKRKVISQKKSIRKSMLKLRKKMSNVSKEVLIAKSDEFEKPQSYEESVSVKHIRNAKNRQIQPSDRILRKCKKINYCKK